MTPTPPPATPTPTATPDWSAVLADVQVIAAAERPAEALARLVDALRPPHRHADAAEARLAALNAHLTDAPPDVRAGLGRLIRAALTGVDATGCLAEAGIPQDHGFLEELGRRLGRRVLPDVDLGDDLGGVIRRVFRGRRDHLWLRRLQEPTWREFLGLIDITAESVVGVARPLALAVQVLAHHVGSLGHAPEMTRVIPLTEAAGSPFLALSARVVRYLESFDNRIDGDEPPLLDAVFATLAECREAVVHLRRTKHRHGTSLRLTILSLRLLSQIERLDVLLHLTEPVERDFPAAALRLVQALVAAEHGRNQVMPHLRQSADLLALQVVEHAARKGRKYIAHTGRAYGRFLLSSLGGGVLVALFAFFKILLGELDLSLAAQAVLYGLNYALCFVLIYLTGATLATKQPAMTANTIARSMDGPAGERHIEGLAEVIVRVWRSQFISFVGNIAMAFPLGVAISLAMTRLTGAPAADPATARYLIDGLHPFASGALFYAAVAGVFLSLAGLLSGWLDNRNLYRRIPERVARHPALERALGPRRTARLGRFVDHHLGALGGNIFFGFCLGSAGTIGEILGVPFDIRHIAFASANLGTALDGLAWLVPPAEIAIAALGVLLIGFVNFIVSFGLTFTIAVQSRQLTFGETQKLARLLALRFIRQPWAFFIPARGADLAREAQ